MLGLRNFPHREQGSNLGPLAPEASALTTELPRFLSKKTVIFQGSGGGRGSNCLFPIQTHITCDFPGGVRTLCLPPLDPQ